MHLSGAWTDEASANSCNPCYRVSRGHSVGFTQFAVTADRTPRIFANAMSSCGIGYPRPGLARTARPLTYPSKSLPKRELGVSPPRSHPRFGPSCERIGVPTYERCLSPAATGLMIGWCALCRTSQWGVRPLLRGEVRRRAFLVANHPTSLKLFQHETIFKFKSVPKQLFKAMNRRRVASALQSAGGRSVALPVGKVGINFCLNFCSCTLKRLCPRFSF